MDIGDRIKQKRIELGWTLKDVANELGVKEATAQRYESGHIKTLKQETISKIAGIFKVNPAWLMGWEGSELPQESTIHPITPMVPVVKEIAYGTRLLDSDNIFGYAPARVTNSQEYFYVLIDDDEMINAGIEKESFVLIHKQRYAENGQIIVCSINGKGFLKRYKTTGDLVILLSESQKSEPIILKSKEFDSKSTTIIGVAVQHMIIRDL